MISTAAATPTEGRVFPCRGRTAARIEAGEVKASPSKIALPENTVREQGPLATLTSSEKQVRASSVNCLMLELLSSTKWNRVGGRFRRTGCSEDTLKPTTQVLPSSSIWRAFMS